MVPEDRPVDKTAPGRCLGRVGTGEDGAGAGDDAGLVEQHAGQVWVARQDAEQERPVAAAEVHDGGCA